jgi:hypothetical protein
MATNYGSIGENPKPHKKRRKHLINHDAIGASADGFTDEQLKQFSRKRPTELAKQQRAPSVAKSAAAEIWERVEPKKERPDAQITNPEANRIADIYDAVFGAASKPATSSVCLF